MTEQQGKSACERIMALTPGDWYYDGNMKVRTKGTSAIIVDGISPFSPHGVANGYVLAASKDMLTTLIELEKCLSNADDRPYERELIKKVLDKATKP